MMFSKRKLSTDKNTLLENLYDMNENLETRNKTLVVDLNTATSLNRESNSLLSDVAGFFMLIVFD